jgi:hypothetical protein
MRDEDHTRVGANPIFPVLTEQAALSAKSKTDNSADILARLNRNRDEKHVPPTQRMSSIRDAVEDAPGAASEGLSFADLVDVINPLQHIPGVSTLYRSITGDEISPAAKVAGNALFLGPIGAATALLDVAVDELTGNDIGEHVVSWFSDEESSQVASDARPEAGDTAAASLGGEALNGQVLSATEPFFLAGNGAETPAFPTEAATGFANAAAPVALESLPADILAALYSGQPQQSSGTQAAANFDSASNQGIEEMPRWSLFSTPENSARPQATPGDVTRAYGADPLAQMSDIMNEPGAIGAQGGWFSTIMPEAIARYEHSAVLQRQNLQPIVDVQQ